MPPLGRWRRGLSPRGRRHPINPDLNTTTLRSISAWAEASHLRCDAVRTCEVYLRVGGGIMMVQSRAIRAHGLSPRGRRHPALQYDYT